MQNFPRMDVLEWHTYLQEPIHNLSFSEPFAFLSLFLNVVCQITHFTELHDDDEDVFLYKTALILNNVDMV